MNMSIISYLAETLGLEGHGWPMQDLHSVPIESKLLKGRGQRTVSQMESRMTVFGAKGGKIEQKGKRTYGHGQQYGDCWGKDGIRRLNGNGKIQ